MKNTQHQWSLEKYKLKPLHFNTHLLKSPKLKGLIIPNVGENMKRLEFSNIAGGSINTLGNHWVDSYKVNIHMP